MIMIKERSNIYLSSRRQHTRCALVTGVQTCALPIWMARQGDGKTPVMTLPGFTGPELSLQPLNTFLNANGYIAKSWGLGANRGVRDMDHMESISRSVERRLGKEFVSPFCSLLLPYH